MITPPAIRGCWGTSIPLAAMPRWSSQTATTTEAATTNMNAVFQIRRVARMTATSTTALAIETGTLRPARPWSWVGAGGAEVMRGPLPERSDLEQLGFFVLEKLVDGVGVLLGEAVEPLLGTGDVVLADLVVLLELLELLLGVAAQVADGDLALLGLVAGGPAMLPSARPRGVPG